MGNAIAVLTDGTWAAEGDNAKLSGLRLKPGDRFRLSAGGGGGVGDPRRRNIDLLADDVAQGYVSPEAAAGEYHAVVDAAGRVDRGATDLRRKQAEQPR
jgi:N-methylhydantoinase B